MRGPRGKGMALRHTLILVMGCWSIFGLAYLTQPIDVSINDPYLAAPELAQYELKEVDGILTIPTNLSPVDIPQAELRLAAQEVSPDDWEYIQLRPYPLRPQETEPFRLANTRQHEPEVVDKQIKRAWRSAVKKKRRVRNASRGTRRKSKVAKRVKKRRAARTSKKKVRRRLRKKRVAQVRRPRTKSNTTRGYKKELALAFGAKK